jgi:hypothetical protein
MSFNWLWDYIKYGINKLPVLAEERTLFVKVKILGQNQIFWSIVFWWTNWNNNTFEFASYNDYLMLWRWAWDISLRKNNFWVFEVLWISYDWNKTGSFLDNGTLRKIDFVYPLNTVLTTYWWVWWWRATFFNWIVDEVRIYNRALSDSEMQILYNVMK